VTTVARVEAFHTNSETAAYRPEERYVYHNQSECGYGQRIIRDGYKVLGIGTDPHGYARKPCDTCRALA